MKTISVAHSETHAMYLATEIAPGLFMFEPDPASVFAIKDGVPEEGFVPTHVHYKGGLYRVLGFGLLDGVEMTLYGDAKGNNWARPRKMFDDRLVSGTPRFAPLRQEVK